MEIYEDLLGLKFTELDGVPVWHEDVNVYQVHDKATNQTLGEFYLDLHPRDNKYGHAAVFPILKRAKIDGKIMTPAAAMVTNFDKPHEGKPSLMQHSEVTTFFHEFGHVMHNLCSEANYKKFSGTSVERDFVELPSQMLENWMWDREVISKVSKHYKTGEKLPEESLVQMEKVRRANQAMTTLQQVFLGTFDFMFHSANDASLKNSTSLAQHSSSQKGGINFVEIRNTIKKDGFHVDSMDLYRKLKKDITGVPEPEGTAPVASFGHIVGGYASAYYGYLWSLVYASEVFTQF
jgi:thimet oligopeptidase